VFGSDFGCSLEVHTVIGPIEEPLASWVLLFARVSLAMVYLISGIHKAVWYRKAVDEFRAANAPLVRVSLPLTIGFHLAASMCLIAGVFVHEVAILLAAFTLIATLGVHRFWRMRGVQRLIISRVALGNLAIIGGLLALAIVGPGRLTFG